MSDPNLHPVMQAALAPFMPAENLIALAIATRKAASLSLKAYGAEGFTVDAPFNYHAPNSDRLQSASASLVARGFTVEVLS